MQGRLGMLKVSSSTATFSCRSLLLVARYAALFVVFGVASLRSPGCAGTVGFRACHCESRPCFAGGEGRS